MARTFRSSCMSGLILSAFLACGKAPAPCDGDSLMSEPHACLDRASLGFGREFGTATIIGTRPVESLTVRNGGVKALEVSGATYSGDPAFTVSFQPETPASVPGNKNLFVQVEFAPTEARAYAGVVTLTSNAVNTDGGTLTIAVSGCGLPPDSNRACAVDADCASASQRCARASGDGGRNGVCVGVSPCYRDGGLAP
jgi:hypothetical protein